MIRGSDIIAAASQKELDNFAEYFALREGLTEEDLRQQIRDNISRTRYTTLKPEDADRIPLKQVGGKWRTVVKPPPRKKEWAGVQPRKNSLAELETAGYVNMFDGPRLSRIKMVKVTDVYETEKYGKDDRYIEELAAKLREGEADFRAIVIEGDGDGGVLDGHHRLRAVKLLGWKKIPAQEVTYP